MLSTKAGYECWWVVQKVVFLPPRQIHIFCARLWIASEARDPRSCTYIRTMAFTGPGPNPPKTQEPREWKINAHRATVLGMGSQLDFLCMGMSRYVVAAPSNVGGYDCDIKSSWTAS